MYYTNVWMLNKIIKIDFIFDIMIVINNNKKVREGVWAYHTRIISDLSFPSALVFSTTSQYNSNNFLIVWSLDGVTNLMIGIKTWLSCSPFRVNITTFFNASIFCSSVPFSKAVFSSDNCGGSPLSLNINRVHGFSMMIVDCSCCGYHQTLDVGTRRT